MKYKYTIICFFVCWSGVSAQTKYDKGQAFFDQKKYAEAVSAFREVISASPKDDQAWYLLGAAFELLGQHDSSVAAEKKALDLNEDLLDAYVALAQAQLALNNGTDAMQTINTCMKILKKQKEYPPLILQLAKAQFATGQIDLALVSFAKYGEQVPGDYRAYEGEGDVYAKQGVAPMAITQYEKSLELDSTQISIIYKLGNTYMSDRQYTEAARVFNKVLILQPDNDNARLDLAGLYFRAKLWWQCAHTLKEYIEKQNDAPRNLQTMYLEALYRGRLFKDGLAPAEKFLITEPNNVYALRIVARAYFSEQKDYRKSIDAFVKLSKIDTLQFDECRLLGDAYRQIKNDTLALAAYLQAVKLDSTQSILTQATLYGDIGSIYMNQRNWEQAANYLELRVKTDTSVVAGYINLAACYQQMEKYGKAIENLERAISIKPEYAPAYVNMGFCYVAMKEFGESRKWFEKAVKVIDTMETKYRIQLADANKMIGLSYLVEKKDYDNPNKKWEEGAAYLERALKYKEDDANSHVWLGQAYQNLQKKEDAIKNYKRALKLDPKNKDAKTGLDTLEPQ